MTWFWNFMDWLAHKFRVASGKKLMGYLGWVTTILAGVCTQLGSESWMMNLPFMKTVCGFAIFIGVTMAWVSKSPADGRTDEQRAVERAAFVKVTQEHPTWQPPDTLDK